MNGHRGAKGKSKSKRLGAEDGASELRQMMGRYVEWMEVRNFSVLSCRNAEVCLRYLAEWCEQREVTRAQDVVKPIIDRYQRHVFYLRKKNGNPLSVRTQAQRLVYVRSFFKWMARNNFLLFNPASELELPKVGFRLPALVLTPAQAEAVLAAPAVSTPLGVRDRAILETFYSTGMRRMELVGLNVFSVNFEQGTVFIRAGKGQKDRVVPIGARPRQWVARYLDEVRPGLVVEPDSGSLFLSVTGQTLGKDETSRMVSGYVKSAGVAKAGSCHLFRHAMATGMLENGADIRFIQQILGHAKLDTTQVYTHLSIAKLREIHAATHPESKPVDAAAVDAAPSCPSADEDDDAGDD